jgi:hypothetical protein
MVCRRPWKSFPEHLELLKSRGMMVIDKPAAHDYPQRGALPSSQRLVLVSQVRAEQDRKSAGITPGAAPRAAFVGMQYLRRMGIIEDWIDWC